MKATELVQRALDLSPSHKDALQLLARIKRVQELRALGNEHYNAGRVSEALPKFTKGLEHVGESESEGMGGLIRANLLLNHALSFYRVRGSHLSLITILDKPKIILVEEIRGSSE